MKSSAQSHKFNTLPKADMKKMKSPRYGCTKIFQNIWIHMVPNDEALIGYAEALNIKSVQIFYHIFHHVFYMFVYFCVLFVRRFATFAYLIVSL